MVLFDDTPLHKANFIKLAEDGFTMAYSFHRIKEDFRFRAETQIPEMPKRNSSGSGDGVWKR
jgi:cyclophilin family peptidyl-prolyl cis-trans isomerase